MKASDPHMHEWFIVNVENGGSVSATFESTPDSVVEDVAAKLAERGLSMWGRGFEVHTHAGQMAAAQWFVEQMLMLVGDDE